MTAGSLWRRRWPAILVGALVAIFAIAMAALSIQRHRAFFTARYDLGNMVQAVWSVAHGGLLESTSGAGEQFSRLGVHVDPILGLFAPLWWVWPSPVMLLVVQAAVVATAAIPAYLLAQRWIGRPGMSVTFAAVTLLLPATQWATLFDFHPVTLAIPFLLWAIWAAVTRHNVVLIITLVLACSTKEHVGLAVMFLGIWMVVSLGRRRAGWVTAACGLLWSVVAVGVVIPHYAPSGASAIGEERYGELGSTPAGLVRTLLTDPVLVIQTLATQDRLVYLVALLLPLLGLALLSPLLAAGALPELLLNLLSARPEQHSIEYHYSAVMVPFLVAAAIDGYARLARHRPQWTSATWSPVAVVGVAVIAGWHWGPLPFWSHVPGGSVVRAEQFTLPSDRQTLNDAVALIPSDAVVSAGNRIGGHLSERRRILTFPVVDDAEWVVVDRSRPDVNDRVDQDAYTAAVEALMRSDRFRIMMARDGVVVFRRTTG